MNISWRSGLRLATGIALTALGAGLYVGSYRDRPLPGIGSPAAGEPEYPAEVATLMHRLAALRPRGVFLIVDTVANRLQVRRGDEVLHEAVCSTGTGWVLEDPTSPRRWVFETPRGVRKVLGKRRDPVWIRPDWSFIEEGVAPPARWSERVDRDVLGDWALDLGDGYMIHGTLFQRYLGRSITHGCIRLGDADLEYVSRVVSVGATVLLY